MLNTQLKPLRFENCAPRFIAGIQQIYTEVDDIPLQWQKFVPQIPNIPERIGKFTAYGVVVCMKDQGFGYLSGVEVSDISHLPKEFTYIQIPALRYAVFAHEEHVSKLNETVTAIMREWLPESDYEPARQGDPMIDILERYGDDFDPQTGMGGMEIWVPIKA